MSEKQHQGRRGDNKRHYRKPVRGGGSSGQPQKQYKRVVSAAKTDGGGDTTTPSTPSLNKLDGQVLGLSEEPRKSPLESDTKPEPSAAVVPHSDASHIQTDKRREDSFPASGVTDQTASNAPSIRDETSREVDLRFGSFAPDLATGMKMPPRTSSAPPNPDEQRWKQGHYTAFRPKNIMLPSSFSNRQQSPNGVSSQQNYVQRDVHSHLQPPAVTDPTIPSLSPSGGPMNFPPQQSHMSAQYGMRSPPIQAPGMPPISPHVPTPLPVVCHRQVRHPTFSPGLPPMPHGPMNQGQAFNFSPQSVHQFSHQSGSPGGVSHCLPLQHIRNLSPRTAVKITNPNTNEELKLEDRVSQLDLGSSTPGSHHNVGFQSHPTAYNHSHQTSYFPHVHRAPVILQNPPSRFSSPGSHGMTISSELSHAAKIFVPNSPGAAIHMTVKSENSSESSKVASSASSPVTPSKKSAESMAPSTSVCLDRAPTADDASVKTDDGKLLPQVTDSEKWKMVSMKDTQVETSNFVANSTNVETNDNETLSGLVSIDHSDVESPNIVSSSSRSGLPDDGYFSPSRSPGKSSVKSRSNSKPTIYRVKNVTPKGKKNRKEMSQNTDTAGSTSNLMDFKAVDKKSESTVSSESTGSFSRKGSSNFSERDTDAEMSSVKLEHCTETEDSKLEHCVATMGKKYSLDFLLSLSKKVSNIPSNFRITYDLRQTLLDPKAVIPIDVSRNTITSWEQITEKPSGVLHPGSHGSGFTDDGRWNKSTKSVSPAFESRTEASNRGDAYGFRSGQGGPRGNLRSPRNQVSGLPHLVSPGGNKSNAHDIERWQHASGLQKALNPAQVMHKAEKKYEIGKVSDAEEAKYRQLKAILNKLTPQNFERLFEQVKQVKIDNAETLSGVIAQIFDKALMEPTFCEMYARFCFHLAGELPDFIENDQKITFKRLLLNKCQEEFERGEREQAEADRDEGEGEVKQSDEEREEKRICARRRMLGNIRLIGELYKKKMLTERIMHECIQKLLRQHQNPDEEDIESLCKLMSTIGEMIDHPKAREYMDAYFEMMTNMSNNMTLSSRLRFMLKDAMDLRENKWQERRKVEGPQKIEELHRDAAQERQAGHRMTRGSSFTPSRRGPPADFGHRRPPMFSPPGPQMLPPGRGIGTQDVRLEERGPADNRIRPVPFSPRPMDTQVGLGPSGSLAKGLSVRGPPVLPGPPRMDQHSSFGDFRGTPGSMNGYNSMGEWRPHGTNQEAVVRFQGNPTRPSIYGQPHRQGHVHPLNSELMNPGHPPGRSVTGHLQRPSTSNILSGKAHSEEHLNKMSMYAIKEFYSARDEKELIMCVKDLDTPSFHPSMISLWVNDSFERGNRDRDLLSKLLVSITKSREGILNINQLSDGFRLVLANLEDAVTDAPKAAVYLGSMFGRIVIENVISLSVIGRLLQQGGEKPFELIQNGLGYEVLENALEVIQLEKGESSLEEICKSSNLRLEEFRPPAPK